MAYGYVLDSAPIAFKVDGEKTIVTVEKFNMPQKASSAFPKAARFSSPLWKRIAYTALCLRIKPRRGNL
ncbi:MAG: hypothetical protein ACLR56_04345 [Oscillospiraceae bacterium]